MFSELLSHPDVEERIELGSSFGLLALHGGLEPGTAEVVDAVAERVGASRYVVWQPRTLAWHVPARDISPFESRALERFLAHVDIAVSVHGYGRFDLARAVLVGGANRRLAGRLGAMLRDALPEYEIVDRLSAIPVGLRGVHPDNPVNLPRRGGVQLELPHPVRAVGPFGRGDHAARYRAHTEALVDTLARFATEGAA